MLKFVKYLLRQNVVRKSLPKFIKASEFSDIQCRISCDVSAVLFISSGACFTRIIRRFRAKEQTNGTRLVICKETDT